MPAYTSNPVTGDFFANGSWVGGMAPDPNGIDTTTLANGAALTVASAITGTLGDPANPTVHAVRTAGSAGTGRLIVNGTLRVAANVLQGNAHWEFNGAGTKLESTNTTTPLTYQWGDTAGGHANLQFTLAGTGIGNRAVIRNGAGAAGFRFVRTSNNVIFNTSWARFFDLGTTTLSAISVRDGNFTVEDTEFDTCGLVEFAAQITTRNLIARRVRIANAKIAAVTSNSLSLDVGPANATGTRTFEDIVVTAGVSFLTWPNAGTYIPTLTRCTFLGGFNRTSVTVMGNFVDCLWNKVGTTLAGAVPVNGNITRGFVTTNSPTLTNWHAISISNNTAATTCDGLVIDGVVNVTAEQGEMLWVSRDAAAASTTIRNVLATRAPTTGGTYGKFVALTGDIALSAAPSLALIEHCTTYAGAGDSAFLVIQDAGTAAQRGYPGVIGTVRHNLVVGLAANSAAMVHRTGPTQTNDVRDLVSAATVTDNTVFNPFDGGSNGIAHNSVGTMWNGTIPTYTTRTDTPQFVEERNLATWYRSLVGGTPGTRTDDMALALAALGSQWSDSPVAGATTMAAWTSLREGYRPQNAALNTGVSANNGGWQGAVEGVTGGPTPTVSARIRWRRLGNLTH